MIIIMIDGRPIQVESGTTVLEAMQRLAKHIPTLCFAEGFEPSASCLLCAVQVSNFSMALEIVTHPSEVKRSQYVSSG
jgi:NADH dehydrogenase/NADH:ubiquinone oxidoreductase subunit G